MSSAHDSSACCQIPPIQAKGYSAQGTYLEWDGMKVYVTGPKSATKGIFYVYDIFGFTPQTLQGADILAKSGNYQVIVPDFYKGEPANPAWWGGGEENEKKKAAFMGALTLLQEEVKTVFVHANKTYPQVTRWGGIGYCWGGKVVTVNSGPDAPWHVALQTSPASVDSADAAKLTVPMATLASGDEPADKVKEFGEKQQTPKLVQTYEKGIHGFMSARANLEDATALKQYEEGYKAAVGWFSAHL